MSTKLRVLVEVSAARARGDAAALNLPGFVATSTIVPEAIRHREDTWGERGFVVRGHVSQDALAELRRHADVLDVYLDTEVVPFPVSDEQMRGWSLDGTATWRLAAAHAREQDRISPE